jgi:hypothetical protein
MAEIQQNSSNTETNAQHNSATTHTHKVQYLHAVIGANRVSDGASTDGANFITALFECG